MSNDGNPWQPKEIIEPSFQRAWIEACGHILACRGELRNLLVQISDISLFDTAIDRSYCSFCAQHELLLPKAVAYTIFPQNLSVKHSGPALFDAYNRQGGFFDRIGRIKATGWGTYFRRMTHYPATNRVVNQLERAIHAIRKDKASGKVYSAAYSLVIQRPGGETTRRMGGPCLNHITLQLVKEPVPRIGMLAVYRNHDFLQKAYGNYLGLGQLLSFIANEVDFGVGPLTCVSSHAYIPNKVLVFRKFLGGIR